MFHKLLPRRPRKTEAPQAPPAHDPNPIPIKRHRSLEDFQNFSIEHANNIFARRELEKAVEALASLQPVEFYCTVHSGLSEFSAPEGRPINWRENLLCAKCNLNARMRFSISLMRQLAPKGSGSRVYMTEQATFGFVETSRIFSATHGSEYIPDPERREALSTYMRTITSDSSMYVRHEDATDLSFDDAYFDIVGSFEVLEHIPDYASALREFARVLAPGGILVLSAPFLYGREETLIRAKIDSHGNIQHLFEPEYHGDPLADGGVLCYYHFGWDLLTQIKSAGFSHAEVVTTWSPALGLFGDHSVILANRL